MIVAALAGAAAGLAVGMWAGFALGWSRGRAHAESSLALLLRRTAAPPTIDLTEEEQRAPLAR